MSEHAISFNSQNIPLIGILHKPEHNTHKRGIVFIVGGGPQYRAGGHRQLTLWSRRLCSEGYPVFRFDYQGMGDSYGEFKGFTDLDNNIRTAINCFTEEIPELDEIVLWGECDASSAILYYAYQDHRVKGIVLLNPWVRTEAGQAKTLLRFYYFHRILQLDFWKKIIKGKFNPLSSIKSITTLLSKSRSTQTINTQSLSDNLNKPISRSLPLTEALLLGLKQFNGPIMLILSGKDLIAQEFNELIKSSPSWQEQLNSKSTTRYDFPDSDHTFSSAIQRNNVINRGLEWLSHW